MRTAKKLGSYFYPLGIPSEILTDKGSDFMSAMLKELYKILHIRGIHITAQLIATNGLVERLNGTIQSIYKKMGYVLPFALFTLRDAPQVSTSYSPFQMIYGWEN